MGVSWGASPEAEGPDPRLKNGLARRDSDSLVRDDDLGRAR
jgi:hypothetical protein